MRVLLFDIILLIFMYQVTSQCLPPFSTGNNKNFCYYSTNTALSWTDAYSQCLSKAINGILIQITTNEQFNALKSANIDGIDLFWLGANNFATFSDSKWHWIDGTIVDRPVIQWCPDSTYETAIGTHCAAYNTTSKCVTNYLCNTPLPALCVALSQIQSKSLLTPRLYRTGTCTNSYGGPYANWWTYTLLLLNWFILFCFILHLSNRFNLNKRTVIITIIIVILSFMTILAFAILWGVQYQDIILIPLILVILGCIASVFFFVAILVLVSNGQRVQRWIACIIATVVTMVIECLLMIGMIICIANCSAYISLSSTSLDKDVIASVLAAIMTAITVTFYNLILCLIGDIGQDRIHVLRPSHPQPTTAVPLTTISTHGPRRSDNNQRGNSRAITSKKHEQIERATSPVDERILNEFYADRPKDMHKYHLEGRQYVVYEGKTFNDIDPFRNDITQAMLLQEPQGLRDAIARVKNSVHAASLSEEIRQAENLLNKLK